VLSTLGDGYATDTGCIKPRCDYMTERDARALRVDESWDTYWRGALSGAAFTSGGTSHPAIQAFWIEFFRATRAADEAPEIIDIASGTGAVIECAKSAYDGQLPDFTCLDVSASAIRILEQRYPSTRTIVANASKIPLDSHDFDIVTSQFGIEYAGVDAIDEVARLVAPGGQLCLLLHNLAGSIHEECAASLDAIERMQQAEFIPHAIAMFESGFAACGGAERADYDIAAKRLAPAVQVLESIMTQHGKHVAGDMVMRLYDDVATIHEQMRHYVPSEVLEWLNRLHGELHAFAGRMASMCDAAIDRTAFERICDGLREHSFSIARADALVNPGQQSPLAWALIATRE